MNKEAKHSQLSIIVDSKSTSSFDIGTLWFEIFSTSTDTVDHHYWYFAGLRSFTINFREEDDETFIERAIEKLKILQTQQNRCWKFWFSLKKRSPDCPLSSSTSSTEAIRKNRKISSFLTDENFWLNYSAGALKSPHVYMADESTEIKETSNFTFYHDRIDLDYGQNENRRRKTLKAEIVDKCVVIKKNETNFTIFINTIGNLIDYQPAEREKNRKLRNSFVRIAPENAHPFYSTVKIIVAISRDENVSFRKERLKSAYLQFVEFFERNQIEICFGEVKTVITSREIEQSIQSSMQNAKTSFIRQYCWQMLLSIGFRFQHRLKQSFIESMNEITDDDEFYQVCFLEKIFTFPLFLCKFSSNESFFLIRNAKFRPISKDISIFDRFESF